MEYKDKRNLTIGILILAGISGIAYYFYRQGKKETTQAELPPNDNTGGGNTPSGASQSELSIIASDLHDDMKGLNIGGYHNPDPYQAAINLSDIDFVRMYNIFNAKYQPTSGETLGEWFSNETYIFIGSKENSVFYAFQKRLEKLNLK